MIEHEQFVVPTQYPVVSARCLAEKTIVVTSRTFFFVSKLATVKSTHPLPIPETAHILSCVFLMDTLLAACVADNDVYYLSLLCLDTRLMITSSPELSSPVYADKTFTVFSIGTTIVFVFITKTGSLNVWPSRDIFLEPFLHRYKFTAITHIYSSIIAVGTALGQILLIDMNGLKILRTLEPFQQTTESPKTIAQGLANQFSMINMAQFISRPQFVFTEDEMTTSIVESETDETDTDTENFTYVNATRELFLQSIIAPSQYIEESDIFIDDWTLKSVQRMKHIVTICYNSEINVLASMSSGRIISYYCLESHAAYPVLFSTYRASCIVPGKNGFLVGDSYGAVLHVTLSNHRIFRNFRSDSSQSLALHLPPLLQLAGYSHMIAISIGFISASDTMIAAGGGQSLSLCTYRFLESEMERESSDCLRHSLSLAFNPTFINKCFIALNGYLNNIPIANTESISAPIAQIDQDMAVICRERDSAATPCQSSQATATLTKSPSASITTSQLSLQTSKYELQEQREYGLSSATVFGEQLFERVIKNNLRDFYRLLVAFGVKQPFFKDIETGKEDRMEFIRQLFSFQDTLQESSLEEVAQLKKIVLDESELLASTIVRVRSAIWKSYSDVLAISYFFGSQLQQIRGLLGFMAKNAKSLSKAIMDAAYRAKLYAVNRESFEKLIRDIQLLTD